MSSSSARVPDYQGLEPEEIVSKHDHQELRLIAKDLGTRAQVARETLTEFRRKEAESPDEVTEERREWARRARRFIDHALTQKRVFESAAMRKAAEYEEGRRLNSVARRAARSVDAAAAEAAEIVARAIALVGTARGGGQIAVALEELGSAVDAYDVALAVALATSKRNA